MQGRSSSVQILAYSGVIATALAVTALGLTTVITASGSLSQASAPQKTLLEVQVESSREIRRALATPISIPPLPPITARLAHELRDSSTAQIRNPVQPKLSPEAIDALAMAQSEATVQSEQVRPVSSAQRRYPVYDRHTGNW